jgi:hypothetical protein
MTAGTTSYIRTTDGATMIEIAPHQFVNIEAARELGILPADRSASKETEQQPGPIDGLAEAAE